MKHLLALPNRFLALVSGVTVILALSTFTAKAQSFAATDAQADSCYSLPQFAGQALYLPDLDQSLPGVDNAKFFFSPSPGSYIENGNTATLTGTAVNPTNGVGFMINVTFSGRQSPPTNPNLELITTCYAPPISSGTINPLSWHTYSTITGTLTGTGGYTGASLTLTGAIMHDFQVGIGASGKNVDLGASGWFNWTVNGTPSNHHVLNNGNPPGGRFGDFNINLSCPTCVDPQLGLGAASGCTVLQLAAAKVSITGPAGGILGDICMAPNSSLSMSGSNYVTGTVKLGPGAKISNSSSNPVNVMSNVNLTAQINAALARAASAAALAPTQTFTTLDGKTVTTINGVAGVNVIKVKDVSLSGKQIYLNGPVGAKFILNVSGKFVFTGGGAGPQIRAAGGVQPKDILYNIIGTGSDVAFSGGGGGVGCCQAIVDGTLLAPNRKINLSPGLVNGQVISGMDISIVSGSGIHCPPCP